MIFKIRGEERIEQNRKELPSVILIYGKYCQMTKIDRGV